MSFTAEKHKKRKQTMTTALAQYLHDVFGIWENFSCFFHGFHANIYKKDQEKPQNNYGTQKHDAIHLP